MVANPQNLKVPSSDEARKNGRKGGLKSAEKRKKLKEIKEIFSFIDKQEIPNEQGKSLSKTFKLDNPTFREAIFVSLYSKILKGDMKALEIYLKLKGEMPKDKIELTGANGKDLMPSKTLTLQEMKEALKKLDESV